jgi:hypothetical protein
MFTFERNQIETPKFYHSGEAQSILAEILDFMCLDARERDQTKLPFQNFEYPPGLRDAVVEAGKGRCAFCEETRNDLTAYPFRPAGNAEPRRTRSDRLHYLWLLLTWRNLFPICSSCRPKDGNEVVFPLRSGGRAIPHDDVFQTMKEGLNKIPADQISSFLYATNSEDEVAHSQYFNRTPYSNDAGDAGHFISPPAYTTDWEKPLFYEPGKIHQPSRNFEVKLTGEILSKIPFQKDKPIWRQGRAAATLAQYNLNSRKKIAARRLVFLERIERLLEHQREPTDDLFDFNNMDFGGTWHLLLRRIGKRWCLLARVAPRLAHSQIKGTFKRLFASNTRVLLERALAELQSEDEGNLAESIQIASIKSAEGDLPQRPRLFTQPGALVQSVSIRNFKALEAIDIAMPKPGNVNGDQPGALLLLGENATGKSSILEAITLSCISQETFDALGIDSGKWVLNPRYMGQKDVSSRSAAYQRECEIVVTLENGSEFRTRFNKTARAKRQMRAGPGHKWRKIKEQDAPLVFAYGAHRLFGRRSDSRGPLSNICTLFDDGQLVTDPEAWMIELFESDPAALDSVVAQLRSLISIDGRFTSIEVVPDPDNPASLSCEMHMKRPAQSGDDDAGYKVIMPLAAVSSGYRTIIALFCDIIAGLAQAFPDGPLSEKRIAEILQTPCTILIDEIEAHLHPRWKMNVISGLRSVLPNARFLITSHDPLCIRGMSRGEIFVLNRMAAQVADSPEDLLERIETHLSDLDTDLFTVQQILTSDLFKLMTTESPKGENGIAWLADGDPDAAAIAAQVAKALPVGNSEVERLVQKAVHEYLEERRSNSNVEVRKQAIDKIKGILSDSVL